MSDLFTKMKLGGTHHYGGRNFTLILQNADVNTVRNYGWPTSHNRIHYRRSVTFFKGAQKRYKYKETHVSPVTNKIRYYGITFYAYAHGKLFESKSIHVLTHKIVKYSEKVERLEKSFNPRGL